VRYRAAVRYLPGMITIRLATASDQLLETEPQPNPAPLRVLTSWQERLKAR